jgi:hypothetical protein
MCESIPPALLYNFYSFFNNIPTVRIHIHGPKFGAVRGQNADWAPVTDCASNSQGFLYKAFERITHLPKSLSTSSSIFRGVITQVILTTIGVPTDRNHCAQLRLCRDIAAWPSLAA